MERQKTIVKEAYIEGIGIHTANPVKLKLIPAAANSGINFIRIDLPNKPVIKADLSNLIDIHGSLRRTSIGLNGAKIYTIEHLMATLSALGIDNLTVEINSEELPALDGSAKRFFEVLKEAGIKELDEPKKFLTVREPVWINEGDASLGILPYGDFKISYLLSYNHPLLKAEFVSFNVTTDYFESNIAASRTFCLEEEADELKKQGLGKGANYENTLVVGKTGVINNKLRFEDEFARHKVLDLMGDLYLLGMPIKGYVIGIKSGHSLNIKLVKKLFLLTEKLQLGGISAGLNIPEIENLLDIEMIQKILPHRYPFLLVDRIIEFQENKRAVGVKNVTINEPYFVGHFPNRPVMPGVLIVEAMAQVAGVLMLAKKENRGKIAYFMGIDGVRFRQVVTPGDQLILEVNVLRLKAKAGQIEAKAFVEGKLVAEANLMFSLAD